MCLKCYCTKYVCFKMEKVGALGKVGRFRDVVCLWIGFRGGIGGFWWGNRTWCWDREDVCQDVNDVSWFSCLFGELGGEEQCC